MHDEVLSFQNLPLHIDGASAWRFGPRMLQGFERVTSRVFFGLSGLGLGGLIVAFDLFNMQRACDAERASTRRSVGGATHNMDVSHMLWGCALSTLLVLSWVGVFVHF